MWFLPGLPAPYIKSKVRSTGSATGRCLNIRDWLRMKRPEPMPGTLTVIPWHIFPVYGLEEAETFIRTTLRHPDFCRGWKDLVAAGLTDDQQPVSSAWKTVADWSKTLIPRLNAFNKPLFEELGLFDNNPLPPGPLTSADILQKLIETKWKMRERDRDLIVMLHELEYSFGNRRHRLKSCLLVKGENNLRTAMAKTVGLPLGIAAKLILEKEIQLKGLHIPIIPEIYEPVLKELEAQGIRFDDTVS